MFKDKLKELRMQKGISQYELAENLAKWENGNGIPSDVNLEAICEFFNVEEEWLLDRGDIKEVVKNLDKKNRKVLLFVLGLVIPLLLILLSILGFFVWKCPSSSDMVCIALYVAPRGIFVMLIENNIIIVLVVLLVYLYQFIFSFIYWIKDIRRGKLIQIINTAISIACFVITFIIAYNVALNNDFVLFFV